MLTNMERVVLINTKKELIINLINFFYFTKSVDLTCEIMGLLYLVRRE